MSELKRSLNLFDTIMIVSGSMIGSGIFIVSADMMRTLGSPFWVLMCWLISGVITLFAALSYGELAGMMPKAGGQFVYIQKAWGNLMSFLYGWTVFTVIQTGVIAAVAVAFAKFTAVFFPVFGVDNMVLQTAWLNISAAQLLAIALIVFLTYFNSRGVAGGKRIQTLFTSTKLVALFLLISFGIATGFSTGMLAKNFENLWHISQWTKTDAGWQLADVTGFATILVLGTAIIGSLFSSDAWNNVTFIAGEIKNPQQNIPRSLILGTAIVTCLYLLANISYLSLLPLQGNPDATDVIGQGIQFAGNGTDRVGTAAASMIFGDISVYLMALLIMVSTFGCNNGIILAGARVYYAMAHEKLFFKSAGKLNSAGVPQNALWMQAFWASVLCLSGTYGDLLDYVTFASLLFYIVTIAGLFKLRQTEPNANRPYKVLGYPFTPWLYIILASAICLILLYTKPQNTWSGVAIVAIGIPVYYIFLKPKNA